MDRRGLAPSDGAGLDPVGIAFALVTGGFWALYVLAGSRVAAEPGLDGLAVATGVSAVVAPPTGTARVVGESVLVLLAVGAALLASVVPSALQLSAPRGPSTPAFGVLLGLEPAVATLAGRLPLSQDVGPPPSPWWSW